MILSPEQRNLFQNVLQHSQNAYVVGGVVRDLLLQGKISDRDLDIIIEGNAIEVAEFCSQDIEAQVEKFPKFYTAKLLNPKKFPSLMEIDFASARVETYDRPGSLPSVMPATIHEDLKRRDFTINALAIPLNSLLAISNQNVRGACIDHFHGLSDLDSKTIRTIHPLSFTDDPTRIYRGCRYEVRLQGRFAETTETEARQALKNGALGTISNSRKLQEIRKICEEQAWAQTLQRAEEFGLLSDSGLIGTHCRSALKFFLQIKNLKASERIELLLQLAFEMDQGGEDRLKAYGFGKKHFNRWKKLQQMYKQSELKELNGSEVLAGHMLGYSDCTTECRHRSLL